MAVDLLGVGRNGVSTSRNQIEVTTHNIANVNSEGYHRQVADQTANSSHMLGGQYYGTGSKINSIKRIYDEFLTNELRTSVSNNHYAGVGVQQIQYLDQLYSEAGRAIPDSFNHLYSGLANLADLPADSSIRTDVLLNAEHLADEINQMQYMLSGKHDEINIQIEAITDQINTLAQALADLNIEMQQDTGNSTLLDRQDSFIKELSKHTDVTVIDTQTGAKNIMVGGAVMLVTGSHASKFNVIEGDPFKEEVGLELKNSFQTQRISTKNLGGELGGYFDFRDNTLTPIQLELDKLAMGVAHKFNEMQSLGFDLTGNVGQNFFSDINAQNMQGHRVGTYSSNAGNANITIDVTDPSILDSSTLAYELKFTAQGQYNLKNLTTNENQTLTLIQNQLIGADGFDLNLNGAMVVGDAFVIRPTSGSASGLTMTLGNANDIAAASYSIKPDAQNAGDIFLKLVNINNRNATNFPTTGNELTIEINSAANTFELFNTNGQSLGVNAYTPPSINVNGFELSLNADANSIERFTLDFSFGVGDNRNALEMSQINETMVMNSGRSRFIDIFQHSQITIGRKFKSAEIRNESSVSILTFAQLKVDEKSGVNLDEEAANLLKHQQSYQASARVISVAQQLFDTLVESMR